MAKKNRTIEMQDTVPTEPVGEAAMSRSEAAYKRLLAEISAVPEEGLAVINLDVPAIVQTALGVLPEVRALEAEIKKLPNLDVAAFEKLEDYAYALLQLQTLYMTASGPPEALAGLVARATEAREVLLANIGAFVVNGHLSPRRPGELDRSLGHRGIAMDVGRLAMMVREAWPKVQGKTSLTLAQIIEFEALRDQIVSALGLKEQGEALVVEVAAQRHRAYTLFVRAYDEVRRAVSFLRWRKGDVDDIIPSLYSVRAARRRPEPEPETAPVAGKPESVTVPVTAGASQSSAAGDGVTHAAPSAPVPIGHPGSDPFGP